MSDSLQPHGLHAECQASLSFILSQSLFKLMSIDSVLIYTHICVYIYIYMCVCVYIYICS